jgi:hypothetical protein
MNTVYIVKGKYETQEQKKSLSILEYTGPLRALLIIKNVFCEDTTTQSPEILAISPISGKEQNF